MVAHAKIVGYEDLDERGASRTRLLFHALVEDGSGSGISALVHDVSSTGFLIEMDLDLAAGAELQVEFANLDVPVAEIVWRSGKYFGCQFLHPIGPSDLQAIVARSRVLWPRFRQVLHPSDSRDRSAPRDARPWSEPPVPPAADADEPLDAASEQGAHRESLKYPAPARFHIIIWFTVTLWCVLALGAWLAISLS